MSLTSFMIRTIFKRGDDKRDVQLRKMYADLTISSTD